MDYLSIIVPKLINLLLLLLLGVFAVKIHVLTESSLKILSDLLMKIILPILSFNLLLQQKVTFFDLISLRGMVLWQLAIYPLAALVGLVFVRLGKMKYPQSNVHLGCMVSGNYAYVVLPLIYALYEGTRATIYIPLGCSLEALVIWTFGITLFTWGQGHQRFGTLKKVLNPFTFAVLAGFLFNTLNLSLPPILTDTINQVGTTSTPLGMIYLGASLCFMSWGSLANLEHALMYVAGKMIIVPILIYLAARNFLPEAESIVLMLTAASPSMTIAVMVSREYGLDADYATEVVSVSTLACAVTIPILFLCVGAL